MFREQNYSDMAKRCCSEYNNIRVLKERTSLLVNVLIGAIGLGYPVKSISYDPDAVDTVNLEYNIELFKNCGMSIDELETLLYNTIEENTIENHNFSHNLNELKLHASFCPKSFFSSYFDIPLEDFIYNNVSANDVLIEFRNWMKEQNTDERLVVNVVVVDGNVKFFIDDGIEIINAIKSFFNQKNFKFNYELKNFNIEKNKNKDLEFLYGFIYKY